MLGVWAGENCFFIAMISTGAQQYQCNTEACTYLYRLEQFEMESEPSIYNYNAIETGNHIRLLCVNPGEADDPIHCTIVHVNLDDSPDFEALSYVWGDSSLTKSLQVNSTEAVPITNALHNALRCLRSDSEGA